jgi:uncharacterized protein YuzE/predicted RNase H-like HicB family nuclease
MKTVVLKVSLKREEDGRWSATIPGLRSCASWGYSEQEAMANIRDAAEVFIEDMMEAGEDLRELPGPIEVIDEPAVAINLYLWSATWKTPRCESLSVRSRRMASGIKDARAVKGFIAMRMVGELFSITITLRILFPQERSRVFSMEQIGLNRISNDFAWSPNEANLPLEGLEMRVLYDDKSDLLYIRFDDRKQEVINKRVSEDVVLDLGEGDRIIGIEIMDASKHIPLERLLPVEYRLSN